MHNQTLAWVHKQIAKRKGRGFSTTFNVDDQNVFSRFVKDSHMFPSGIVLSRRKRYSIIKLTQEESFQGTITITVSDSYAQNYFKRCYSDEGEKFRQHLLAQRRDLVQRFADEIQKWSLIYNYTIDFTASGIWEEESSDSWGGGMLKYSDYGLVDLNIAQCYGLLLAVLELLPKELLRGNQHIVFSDYDMNFFPDSTDYPSAGRIEVCFSHTYIKPELENW